MRYFVGHWLALCARHFHPKSITLASKLVELCTDGAYSLNGNWYSFARIYYKFTVFFDEPHDWIVVNIWLVFCVFNDFFTLFAHCNRFEVLRNSFTNLTIFLKIVSVYYFQFCIRWQLLWSFFSSPFFRFMFCFAFWIFLSSFYQFLYAIKYMWIFFW